MNVYRYTHTQFMWWKESIHLFENVEQQNVELDESIYVRVMITIDVNTQATRISAIEAPKYWALIQNQRSLDRAFVRSYVDSIGRLCNCWTVQWPNSCKPSCHINNIIIAFSLIFTGWVRRRFAHITKHHSLEKHTASCQLNFNRAIEHNFKRIIA